MLAKRLHRIGAVILVVFIVTHLSVHLFALAGPQAHIDALKSVQWIYRNPFGEFVLALVILMQIGAGFARLRLHKVKRWALAQMMSGLYLSFFLIVHTSAAMLTHNVLGLETDFYWSAGSLHFAPIKYAFALYYLAAIVAVFVHLGAAIRFGWGPLPRSTAIAAPWIGAVLGIVIISAFWGVYYDIEVPDDVASYYEGYFGFLGVSAD